MATYTAGLTTASTTNTDTYALGPFTPAANDLLVVFCRSGETAVAGAVTSSTGLTFTNVTRTDFNTSVDFIDVFVANALTTAVAHTLTWTCTGDAANGCFRVVARISGMTRTGASAIRQIAEQENASAGTPAPVFGSACLTGNLTIAACGTLVNPTALTGPAGWTLRQDSGYNTPATGMYMGSRASGFTGTTVTWGSASATVFGAVVVEYDTSAPAAGGSLIWQPASSSNYSR